MWLHFTHLRWNAACLSLTNVRSPLNLFCWMFFFVIFWCSLLIVSKGIRPDWDIFNNSERVWLNDVSLYAKCRKKGSPYWSWLYDVLVQITGTPSGSGWSGSSTTVTSNAEYFLPFSSIRSAWASSTTTRSVVYYDRLTTSRASFWLVVCNRRDVRLVVSRYTA